MILGFYVSIGFCRLAGFLKREVKQSRPGRLCPILGQSRNLPTFSSSGPWRFFRRNRERTVREVCHLVCRSVGDCRNALDRFPDAVSILARSGSGEPSADVFPPRSVRCMICGFASATFSFLRRRVRGGGREIFTPPGVLRHVPVISPVTGPKKRTKNPILSLDIQILSSLRLVLIVV